VLFIVLALACTAESGLCACGASVRRAPVSGLPAALLAQARPIGATPAFHQPVTGPVAGRCRRVPGARTGVHVELFAHNRVAIVPAGIGTRPPRSVSAGRISKAACFGALVTLEPTGLVLVRPAAKLLLSDLFRSWGQPLSALRLGPFAAPRGTRVAVFVNGRPRRGSPQTVMLAPHSEIVLEVGPHVPPHQSYAFPPGA
jgi:hypothetical protein